MASYKKQCLHCGNFIETDVRFCPFCSSQSPFGYLCPDCLRPVQKMQELCSGCGRSLYIDCPHCKERTFVQEKCENCSKSLMVRCTNKRCKVMQFFQNKRCTACGKKIKS
jgi:RNA polymerase subunit RPABC4/transcription elongation factor Spt4